jgi:hypothetical protein
LSGVVETSLANGKVNATHIASSLMEDLATRGPLIASTKTPLVNNQYYGANVDDSSLYDDVAIKHEVSNDAVMVSSPSYVDRISSYYTVTNSPSKVSHSTSQSQSYVTELPSYIVTHSSTGSEESNNDNGNNFLQFSKLPYDHSGIAHSSAETDVYSNEDKHDNDVNSYQTPSSSLVTETRTEGPMSSEKNKFSKPIFKPKPTHSISTEKYVLVHTITNDKQGESGQEESTRKPSTNDSIQSIILMLNGTNPGPEYNIGEGGIQNSNAQHPSTTTQATYPSTSMIDYDKYGSSSYYITTRNPERKTSPRPPSTSYVYTASPTRRPTTSKVSAAAATTTRIVNKVKATSNPNKKTTTLNVPSTSYLYSPKPITRRPTRTSTSNPMQQSTYSATTTSALKQGSTTAEKKTSPKPVIIVNRPPGQDIENNYVVISGGGITKHPSPTVHITPKPTTNLLTSSTINLLQTRKPPNVQSSTPTPPGGFFSTTPTFISSSIYVPDFQNEGYFAVVTHRPGVSSTAIYAVSPSILHGSTAAAAGSGDIKHPEYDTPVMNNDDFSNFPPVRNPNLNMTATNNVHPVMDESEIATPAFVEDTQLNSKIDLLVNKLIGSMQSNLDNLVDIVYERKNLTDTGNDNVKKNGTIGQQSVKPTRVPQKTTVGSKITTKVPPKGSTAPPGRPSQQQTTKKTPAKATTVSTKKPSTKKPSATTVSGQSTKRPSPNRITSSAATTRKPTRKVTTTTSTTAKTPALEDEEPVVDEETEEEEETAEEGEENNVVDESEGGSEVESPPAVENGRIRKI